MQAGALNMKFLADMTDLQRKFGQAQDMAQATANRIGGFFTGMGARIAGALSVAGLAAFVQASIKAADEVGKISQRTGVAVQDLGGLQLAWRQSGASAEQFVPIMAKVSTAIASGNKALEAMGVQTRNTDGTLKSTRQVLGEVSDKFASYQDGAGKTALAVKLLGEEGAKALPFLNGGAKALDEYDEMARRLGLTLDQETTDKAAKFNDTLDLIGQSTQGIGRQMAAELLPTLQGLAGQFFNSMTSGDRLRNTAEFLSNVLKGLYVVALGVVEVFSSVGKTIGAVAATIGANVEGMVTVITRVMSGDFAGAWEAAKSNVRQVGSIVGDVASEIGTGWKTTLGEMSDAWNASGDAGVGAMAAIVKATPPAIEEAKKLANEVNKAAEAYAKLTADYDEAEDKNRQKVFKARLEYQEREEKLLAEELKKMELEKHEYVQALYKKRFEAEEKAIQAAADAQEKAAEDAAAEWQKSVEKIEDMLTDALMRGFENGKGFGENLADSIVNIFKTYVARAIAQAITNAIISAMAGTQWGALLNSVMGGGGGLGGNLGSSVSSLSSLYSAYSTAAGGGAGAAGATGGSASAIGSFAGGSMSAGNTAGSIYANATGTGIDGLLSANGAYGTAGNSGWMAAAGYAALIVAAIAIANNLYSKGYTRAALGVGGPQEGSFYNTTFQTNPNIQKTWADSGFEAQKRSVLEGIGLNEKWSDILSGTTRLAATFGRKLGAYGYEVAVGPDETAVGGYQQYKGGLFRSDKTTRMGVDPRDAEMIRGQVEMVRESAKAMAAAMGMSQEAIDAYTGSLTINFKNATTAEEQAKRLGEAMEQLHFEMLRTASGGQLTKESFRQMMEDVQKLVEQAGISTQGMTDIITQGMLGRMSEAQVGQALADMVLGGIYESIASPFAAQISQAFQAQIITPVFTAILAGVPISQAISQQAIDSVVATAQNAATVLNAIFSDAGFKQAMADIQTAISGVAAASVQPARHVRGLSSAVVGVGTASQQAAKDVKSAWREITDNIIDEIKRLRGEVVGDTMAGLAMAQSQFAIATAQARSGNKDAASSLPQLSRNVEELLRLNSATSSQFVIGQSDLLASLMATAQLLSKKYKFKLPGFAVGTDYVPQDMLAMVHQGEQIIPRAYNPHANGSDQSMAAELQMLRAEVVGLRAEMRANVSHTSKAAKALDRALAPEGDAFSMRQADGATFVTEAA